MYKIPQSLLSKYKVPCRESIHTWSEKYATIPASVNNGIIGSWRSYPYQKQIMEAMTPGWGSVAGKEIYKVSLLKTTRMGYNRLIANMVAYIVHQCPRNIGIYEPNDKIALELAKEEIRPMFEDTDVLRGLIRDNLTADNKNKITHMKLPNRSFLSVSGASPANFRRRNFPVLILDEVDGMPLSIGKEGDPVALAINRTRSNVERMIVIGSSPAKHGESIIAREYEKSDKRKFHVPCPHCSHLQELKFERFEWKRGQPETVVYPCQKCGMAIEPKDKVEMVSNGIWVPTAEKIKEPGHAGFHVSGLFVLTPNTSWPEFIADYENASDTIDELQAFYNTRLGIQWAPELDNELQAHQLLKVKDHNYSVGQIPDDVILLVASVDVQGGGGTSNQRLEVALWGFGERNETWFIANLVIPGDPLQPEIWTKLNEILEAEWPRHDGTVMKPYIAMVDCGGHATNEVYAACFNNDLMVPLHGSTNRKAEEIIERRAVGSGHCYISVGTHKIKDILFQKMVGLTKNDENALLHLPYDIDTKVIEQLCSERKVRLTKTSSEMAWQKKGGIRNEQLDLLVYAWAGMRLVTDQYPLNTWNYVRDLVKPIELVEVTPTKKEVNEDEPELNPFTAL